MVIFSTFAGNKTQPLFDTYVQAAQQIGVGMFHQAREKIPYLMKMPLIDNFAQSGCGPSFVSTSVEMYTGASGKTLPARLLLSTMLLVISVVITHVI